MRWLLVSNQLSKDADAFRINLQAQTNVEIERLRSSLQTAAAERQVRFSKLHDRRALVIARLYRLLLEAKDSATYFAAQPNDVTAAKQAWDQQLKLYRFLHLNKIYFPTTLCELLDHYESKLRHKVTNVKLFMSVEYPNSQMIDEQNKAMLELWRTLEKDLPAVLSELEKEFRSLLGVEFKN